MTHLLLAIKRKNGLSRSDFSHHWREVHAPLAQKLPGLLRYTQNHAPIIASKAQAYDGVVEIWMENEKAIADAFSSPEYRRGAYADEPNFANLKEVVRVVAEDHVLLREEQNSRPETMVKRLSFIKRKTDMSRDDFFSYWKDIHGPMALALPGLREYTQCHATASMYEHGEPPYDGVAALTFDTMGDLYFALDSPAFKDVAQPDGTTFVNSDSAFTIISEEHSIV